MKKGLSVLLIAAALFGFYGGAVNLNDVLACKDYWEVKGEETTADLNKLEDGLNQLKDNEEAYLDGLVAVEDGEEALAKGEQDLAAGKAELAKGEADYAAAPAKLADARAQIAQGEDDLAAGEAKLAAGYKEYNTGKRTLATGKAALASGAKDLQSVKDLINGMKQIVNGYPEWKNGYEQLKDGRVDSIKNPSDTTDLQKVLTAYYQNAGDTAAAKALQSLQKAGQLFAAQDASSFTNDQYDGFRDYLNATVTALDDSNAFFENTKKNLSTVGSQFTNALEGAKEAVVPYQTVLQTYAAYMGAQKAYADAPEDQKEAKKAAMDQAQAQYEGAKAKYGDLDTVRNNLNAKLAVCQATAQNKQLAGAVQLATNVFVASKDAAKAQQVLGALQGAQAGLTIAQNDNNAGDIQTYLTYVGTIPVAMETINSGISDIQENTLAAGKEKANMWLDGYATITGSETVGKQRQIVGGVAKIIGGVLGSKNDELINGMNKVASQVGFSPSQFANASTSKLAKDMASGSKLENFYQDMNKIEKGFSIVIPQLQKKADDGAAALDAGQKEVTAGETKLKAAEKQLAAGEEELAAGRAKLASGKAQYAQGLADYAAAPAKLADGRRKLAEGIQQLEDGHKELADGKEKLAEYEDGEQQVRDGLATLVATEPDGGLTSILERLDGKDKFDDPNGHLELDEGLNAVTVGREYQSDSGELITEEITKRAIGTAAGFGAAALAVLAAILSFLKKNKGAGVTAILSAVAGAVGVGVGTSAGMEFSHIAGSTVSSMPWIAAGILAAVAVAHAITHFAGSKAA